jgi:transposase-like protein
MEQVGRVVEKMEMRVDEKRKRKGLRHTAEEKCQAVLTLWTERRKPGEICREMGVAWGVLKQWEDRAMEGMLLALQPRVQVERGVALSPRLAVLLEKNSRVGMMRGLDRRLKKLQKDIKGSPEVPEVSTEKKL